MKTEKWIFWICVFMLLSGIMCINVGETQIQRGEWRQKVTVDPATDEVDLMWQGVFVTWTENPQAHRFNNGWCRTILGEGVIEQVPDISYIGAADAMSEPFIVGNTVTFYVDSTVVQHKDFVPWWYVPIRNILWVE